MTGPDQDGGGSGRRREPCELCFKSRNEGWSRSNEGLSIFILLFLHILRVNFRKKCF